MILKFDKKFNLFIISQLYHNKNLIWGLIMTIFKNLIIYLKLRKII